MRDNIGRELTLRVIITDPKKAEWIWKNHIDQNDPMNVGVRVSAIAEGNLFQQRDELALAATFYVREEGETTEEAVDAHFGDGYDTPEEAAKDANNNVSPGAGWDIVDRKGNVYRSGKNV